MNTERTKKQKEALELAIHILQYEPHTLKTREWDNLFEAGFNNTNSLIIGLIEEMDKSIWFYQDVLYAREYIPDILINYALYKAGESRIFQENSRLYCMVENLLEAINKTVYYTKPFDCMTQEKWDNLYKYSIEPIIACYNFIQEKGG